MIFRSWASPFMVCWHTLHDAATGYVASGITQAQCHVLWPERRFVSQSAAVNVIVIDTIVVSHCALWCCSVTWLSNASMRKNIRLQTDYWSPTGDAWALLSLMNSEMIDQLNRLTIDWHLYSAPAIPEGMNLAEAEFNSSALPNTLNWAQWRNNVFRHKWNVPFIVKTRKQAIKP